MAVFVCVGVRLLETDIGKMLATLGKGYGSALLCGLVGYLFLGGEAWAWGLFIWIAGAPATLFFARPSDRRDAAGNRPAARAPDFGAASSGLIKTRFSRFSGSS